MKTTTTTLMTFAMTALVLWSCSPLDPLAPGPVNTGSVSFARFYALGDNYTAGMQNAGLVEGFQKASWPAVLAGAAQAPRHRLQRISENGIPPTMYVADFGGPVIDTLQTAGQPKDMAYPDVFNNLGIPAATLNQLLTKSPDPINDLNPFFTLILRFPPTLGANAVAQAVAAQPSLLCVWAGWMDIYASASAGTDAALTPAASFEADYQTMMNALASAAGAVVAANIPGILDIPFFVTIPPVVVDPDTGQPVLIGGNPVPLIGPSGDLSPDDKVLLTAARFLAGGDGIPTSLGGTGNPLPGEVVVEVAELTAIQTRIGQFNAIIDTVCSNRGIPVVDAHGLFTRMNRTGFEIRGETYTAAYLSNSLFGVDGLHPNSIGYYVIALEFIEVINGHFGAAIPRPVLPMGIFRDPALGATDPMAVAATVTPQEWGGLMRLMNSGVASARQ